MNWDQPICDVCWEKQFPERTPYRMRMPDPERCSYCGAGTLSGIYVRDDPREVPYPAKDDGD